MIPVAYANAFRALEISHVDAAFTNNATEAATLRFVVDLPGYTTKETAEVVRVAPGGSSTVALHLNFDATKLADLQGKLRASMDVTVSCMIGDKTETIYEKAHPVEILGPNEAVLGALDENGEWQDWGTLLPVFITPESPAVQELLRMAAEYHPDGSIAGYQCGACDEDEWTEYTTAQVEAIYDALKYEYAITYINMPGSFGSRSEGVATQRVNLPEDSMAMASANCLDGTLLFASALEAIGIKSYIVLIPGHAYLAWDTAPDEDDSSLDALETTMLGSADFDEANLAGLDNLDRDWDSLFDEENLDYWLIGVRESREAGVEPLAG